MRFGRHGCVRRGTLFVQNMSTQHEHDGDTCRKAAIEDGVAIRPWRSGLAPLLPARPFRSDADAERDILALRRRAERLANVLQAMTMADPPTIPDGEEGLLMAFVVAVEDRIARAANDCGSHAYARREPGRPISCPKCARPIDRAAEACFA